MVVVDVLVENEHFFGQKSRELMNDVKALNIVVAQTLNVRRVDAFDVVVTTWN